ncbi:hypothetical protein B0E45_23435 [Sinorhizobium sp. A49]|nr:hypothetical protein B0E45_23435 [Sinorhizobium sp. A49]
MWGNVEAVVERSGEHRILRALLGDHDDAALLHIGGMVLLAALPSDERWTWMPGRYQDWLSGNGSADTGTAGPDRIDRRHDVPLRSEADFEIYRKSAAVRT